MDRHTNSHFAGRLAVVETGRRRRWSAEEKRRIVEESLAGYREASVIAYPSGSEGRLVAAVAIGSETSHAASPMLHPMTRRCRWPTSSHVQEQR